MASLSTARDRYNAANSLLCLLQYLEGHVTTVELRNEMAAKGVIAQVDGFMNIIMQDVTVQGNNEQLYQFEEFFIKARNIRYVQIPEDVNITEAIQAQVSGKPRMKPNLCDTTKSKLARKKQRETLKFIQQQEAEAKMKSNPLTNTNV